MTAISEVRSASFGLVSCVHCLAVRGAPGECYHTLYYVVKIILHRRVWYHVLSLRYACIRSPGIILIP